MNDTINSIISLKTTRRNNFSERRISDKMFEIIVDSCMKAPNASNRQSYSIIIIAEK